LAGLDEVRASPADGGALNMIVRRPRSDEREEIEIGNLTRAVGLEGDDWCNRGSSRTTDGGPHPDMQVTIINRRFLQLIAVDPDRMVLAGDQLVADFDLSELNLPAGTQISIGDATLEITSQPHTGCRKFSARFGVDALRLVNSPVGRELRLRGVNAKVMNPGTIRVGDTIDKL